MTKLAQIFERIKTVTGITLDHNLEEVFKGLPEGDVLDVGSGESPYKQKIAHKRYVTCDIEKKNNPSVCCDAHNLPFSSTFDTVICTEVLEHCHSPQKVIDEIYRVLKNEGVCVLSTRFIFQIHGDPADYYRFTDTSLLHLFRDFKEVKIIQQGNRLAAIYDLISTRMTPLRLLNTVVAFLSLSYKNRSSAPLGYVVYAKK